MHLNVTTIISYCWEEIDLDLSRIHHNDRLRLF